MSNICYLKLFRCEVLKLFCVIRDNKLNFFVFFKNFFQDKTSHLKTSPWTFSLFSDILKTKGKENNG